MLRRNVELSEAIALVSLKFSEVNILTASELVFAKVILNVLHPIYDATEEMASESATTLSKVIPMYHNMKQVIS